MKFAISAALTLLLGSGCRMAPSNAERTALPEDSLLVDVSSTERDRVASARVAHGRARDAEAAARRENRLVLDSRVAAEKERDAAHDKLTRARSAVGRSESSGTTADLEAARQAVVEAERDRDLQDAKCALWDRKVIEAEQQVAVEEAQVGIALAELHLAKVVAVNTLDRPEAQKPDIAVFEAEVRRAEGKANETRAGLAAASREVEISRRKLSEYERTD